MENYQLLKYHTLFFFLISCYYTWSKTFIAKVWLCWEFGSRQEIYKTKKQTLKIKCIFVSVLFQSGRLFIRNLAFICTEADLEELFSKYGPLTETRVLVDDMKRCNGMAFVTYMMPEHAVKVRCLLQCYKHHSPFPCVPVGFLCGYAVFMTISCCWKI